MRQPAWNEVDRHESEVLNSSLRTSTENPVRADSSVLRLPLLRIALDGGVLAIQSSSSITSTLVFFWLPSAAQTYTCTKFGPNDHPVRGIIDYELVERSTC